MRDYLRRTCDDIWVINCSPEGHQPKVNTRIFQGVKQPICIVLACRSQSNKQDVPASLHIVDLPRGSRTQKLEALKAIGLEKGWIDGPSGWRDPFLPRSIREWSTYPGLQDLFLARGTGLMPGRTWIIAPDRRSLSERWDELKAAPPAMMDELFIPHVDGEKLGDRHSAKELSDSLPGFALKLSSVRDEQGQCETPIQYAFRSFDRQYIIPDKRLLNRPNPELWRSRSAKQILITAPMDRSPSSGPALTATGLIPDAHHYAGRGGKVFPLWSNAAATESNLKPALLAHLSQTLSVKVSPDDLFAYIVAIVASPAYTVRFQPDLTTPGLRIPLTADAALFRAGERVRTGRDRPKLLRMSLSQTFENRRQTEWRGKRHSGPP